MNLTLGSGILGFGLLGFALGLSPYWIKSLNRQSVQDAFYLIFSGILLGYIFSVLVPHVFLGSKFTFFMFALGLLFMWLLNRKTHKHDVCCQSGGDNLEFGLLSLISMVVCSTNDGFFMGLLDPSWYSHIALGMYAHKLTVSFMVARIVYSSTLVPWQKWALALLYLAMSPAAFFGIQNFDVHFESWIDPLLGFSTGMLLFVAISGTLPRLNKMLRHKPIKSGWLFIPLGLSLIFGFYHLDAHTHHHGENKHVIRK